ncbi:MAG: metallophosphoesterase family protein [Acidimicrobiales bacterium]
MTATVLQLSDTHLVGGPRDRHPDERLGAALAAVRDREVHPDLVVLSGDLTDDASEAACRRIASLLAPLDVPILAIPGNHDVSSEVEAVFGPPGPVELDGWRVLGIASNVPGEIWGSVDSRTVLSGLDTLDERPTALAIHHPLASPSTHPWFQLAGAASLLEGLAARPHVRVVLSGHLHEPFNRQIGDLSLLGAPSTLYAIRHQGQRWNKDACVLTGARLLYLGEGGAWRTELVSTGGVLPAP